MSFKLDYDNNIPRINKETSYQEQLNLYKKVLYTKKMINTNYPSKERLIALLDKYDVKTLWKEKIIENLRNKNNNFFEENYEYFIKRLSLEKLDNSLIKEIYMILLGVAIIEGVNISNIEYINSGSYSYVYKLGNKVIKIGKKRYTPNIPNHKLIAKAQVSRLLNSKDKEVFVEVMDYYEFDPYINMFKALQIYKKLRKSRIRWLDVKPENLARDKYGRVIIIDRDLLMSESNYKKSCDIDIYDKKIKKIRYDL